MTDLTDLSNVTLGDPTVDLSDVNEIHQVLTTEKHLNNVPNMLDLTAEQIGVLGAASKILGVDPAVHSSAEPAFIPQVENIYNAITTGKNLQTIPISLI